VPDGAYLCIPHFFFMIQSFFMKIVLLATLLIGGFGILYAEPVRLRVKVAPPEAVLVRDGEVLPAEDTEPFEGIRSYLLYSAAFESLRFSAPGYHDRLLYHHLEDKNVDLLSREGLIEVKLEPIGGSLRFEGIIPTGSQPKSVLFLENGRQIATALLNDTGIQVFDLESFEEIAFASPPAGDAERLGFVEMVELPGREELWVSQMNTGKIHIFDTRSWRWKSSVPDVGSWPKYLVADPSESRVYASLWHGAGVAEIDVESRKLVRKFTVSGIPRGMALSPSGRSLYVSNFTNGTIELFSIADGKRSVITTGQGGGAQAAPGAIRHLVLNNDGSRLYFSDMYHGRVGAIDTAEKKVLWSRRVGPNVNTIVLDASETMLYVSSRGPNGPRGYLHEGKQFGTVHALKTRDGSPAGWVWGGDQPTGLAVSPDGGSLVFSDFLDHRLEIYRISGDLP
jgi:DNA-binding beta-propeller fold protein YncE